MRLAGSLPNVHEGEGHQGNDIDCPPAFATSEQSFAAVYQEYNHLPSCISSHILFFLFISGVIDFLFELPGPTK